MELFTRINQEGTAILLVTHDPFIAARTVPLRRRDRSYTGINLEERTREVTRRMQAMGI